MRVARGEGRLCGSLGPKSRGRLPSLALFGKFLWAQMLRWFIDRPVIAVRTTATGWVRETRPVAGRATDLTHY